MNSKELQAAIKDKITAAKHVLADDTEQAQKLFGEAEDLKAKLELAKKIEAEEKSANEPVIDIPLPTGSTEGTLVTPPEEKKTAELDEFVQSVFQHRYGDITDVNSKAVTEVYEGDYRQVDYDQNVAFRKYILGGDNALDTSDKKTLSRQWWHLGYVKSMLSDGMTVKDIKATMVEGIDILGGYAVPPERGAAIIARTEGLTAVRDGGATVVTTASRQIEWLELTGGDDQFTTALRGEWGSETQSPSEKNMTTGLLKIPVEIYTYKVPMSVSLLEDATNIMQILDNAIATTLVIDEDTAFLTGDGANKPLGITPGNANTLGLTEVSSGGATTLTMDGLKGLRRGIASQYRLAGRSTMIGNSATGLAIEQLVDGDSRYFFDALIPGQAAPGGFVWRESESMPDLAAASFSLIYGDMSGYVIAERLGLAIQRYNDSSTGINKVEFQVRRRIGGRVAEPWKFAVQQTEV